jgi:hypothetical protein
MSEIKDWLKYLSTQRVDDSTNERLAIATLAHIEDLERQRAVWQEHFDHMAMRIAEARNAALEEAAIIAVDHGWAHGVAACREIAVAIRATKDKPNG